MTTVAPAQPDPPDGPRRASRAKDPLPTRREWLRVNWAHVGLLQRAGLASALPTVTVVLLLAALSNWVAAVYAGRGLDAGARVGDDAVVDARLAGSPVVAWRGVAVGVSWAASSLWIPWWLFFVNRQCGGRALPRRWWACAALLGAFAGAAPATHAVPATAVFAGVAALSVYLAHAVGVSCGFPRLGRLLGAQYVLGSAALFVLIYTLPAAFHGADGEAARVLLRLVCFPALVELCIVLTRTFGRRVPVRRGLESMHLWAHVTYLSTNTLGRLLVLAMRTAGGAAAVVLGSGALELLLRATVLERDALYVRLLRGRAAAAALRQSPRARRVRAEDVAAAEAAEYACILVATAIALAFRTTAAPAALVCASAALQWAVELAADAAPFLFAHRFSPCFADSGLGGDSRLQALAAGVHRNQAAVLAAWRGRGLRRLAAQALAFLPWVVVAATAPLDAFCVPEFERGGWLQEWRSCHG